MLMTSNLQSGPAAAGNRRMFKPPEWQWSQTGDIGWWLRETWCQSLIGPDGLRLDSGATRGG